MVEERQYRRKDADESAMRTLVAHGQADDGWRVSVGTESLMSKSRVSVGCSSRAGTFSPVEAAKEVLQRVERYDPELHAYLTVTGNLLLGQAQEAEAAYRRGDASPLLGVPVAVKNVFHVTGVATTCGLALFAGQTAVHDSGVVRRLPNAGQRSSGRRTDRSSASPQPPRTFSARTRATRGTRVAHRGLSGVRAPPSQRAAQRRSSRPLQWRRDLDRTLDVYPRLALGLT